MVRKFGPFDTSQFYEVENRRMQRALAIGGSVPTGLAGTPGYGQGLVTAGTGAQLLIAAIPDGALVDGLYVENPVSETVALTQNGASSPRQDRLVMRLDMNAKTIAPYQIIGTVATSPPPPPLVQTAGVYDMPLCRFIMPGSGSAQNPTSIVDERIWLQAEGGWQNLATGAVNFTQGADPSWLDLTGLTGQVTVPAGRVLDVEFSAPKIEVPANGGVFLRLLINGGLVDSGAWQAGSTTSFAVAGKLATSIVGGGGAVGILAQIRGAVEGGYVKGDGTTGPRIRYRIS